MRDHGGSSGNSHRFRLFYACVHAFEQMIADAQSIGHYRERRVHRAAGTEEACVHNVEIVEFVRFAIAIQRAAFRIIAETHGAVLMRNTGEWNPLTQIQIPRKNSLVALVPVDEAGVADSSRPELFNEAFVSFFVIGFVPAEQFRPRG